MTFCTNRQNLIIFKKRIILILHAISAHLREKSIFDLIVKLLHSRDQEFRAIRVEKLFKVMSLTTCFFSFSLDFDLLTGLAGAGGGACVVAGGGAV